MLLLSMWLMQPVHGASILESINEARANQQLSALTLEPVLEQLAAERLHTLASREVVSHQPGDDEDLLARAQDLRLTDAAFSENIAVGFTTPEQVITAWLGSTTHRRNVLDSRAVGVGIAQDTTTTGAPLTVAVFRLPITAQPDSTLPLRVVLPLGAGLLLAIILPSLFARRRDTPPKD